MTEYTEDELLTCPVPCISKYVMEALGVRRQSGYRAHGRARKIEIYASLESDWYD